MQISSGVEACDFEISDGRVTAVLTNLGPLSAEQIVLAAGAWSQPIAARLGLKLPVKPMRGQVLLLDAQRILIQRIVNVGRNYLLPRDDGRILVGTTLEDVGFDRRNTAEAIADLLRFAVDLAPELKSANLERAWAASARRAWTNCLTWVACRICRMPSSPRAIFAADCGGRPALRW